MTPHLRSDPGAPAAGSVAEALESQLDGFGPRIRVVGTAIAGSASAALLRLQGRSIAVVERAAN